MDHAFLHPRWCFKRALVISVLINEARTFLYIMEDFILAHENSLAVLESENTSGNGNV